MDVLKTDIRAHRKAEYPVDEMFLRRWSPRAMSGEPISREELSTLLEAARWAPSSFNDQPWRFLFALRDSDHWPMYMNWLWEFNRSWCDKAGALVLIVARQNFSHNNKPNSSHIFDAGAAWENLALQGARMDLVVHCMAGFDPALAQKEANIPADYTICVMAAIGRPGTVEALPEGLRSREVPSGRKPLSEITYEGMFPGEPT